MRKIIITVYSVFLLILIANYLYYKNLYNNQLNYMEELLGRQVKIVGFSVDSINRGIITDLNQMNYSGELTLFFTDRDNQRLTREKLKLFFSKYGEFISGIRLYDNNKNEFTLRKGENGDWLEQTFVLHVQAKISDTEKLVHENRRFDYFLPVLNRNETIGNIVVTVDFQKYFKDLFAVFNLKNYQWQWVISDSGNIVYDNYGGKIEYSKLDLITKGQDKGSAGDIIQTAFVNGKKTKIISSYFPTRLLQREIKLVFSARTDPFQRSIIINSLYIVLVTLLLVQVIIFIFLRYFKSQKSEVSSLKASEKMLYKLIEEMPVGVIIHNKNREIIKANKVAADLYSYSSEEEMAGKLFPETNLPGNNDYFAKNLGGSFKPEQFVIIKKEIGEIILYRNSIPFIFKGEDATMEILIDVTLLESARKHEAKANVAKSEFLARMSYEIRTPLNGILGMTEILNKYELSAEITNVVNLLRRSTGVLLNIINDILDFSRIESGKMILDEVPFNLREEINYCVDLARTNISKNNLVLICNIDEKVPESIIGDPFRLRQVLTNLLNHSIKNTETGEIHLNCMLRSNKNGIITLGFELLDTGLRFDKASLKKIFGDFLNIESKAARTNDESGFGTILSKQLVVLMGGELIAESPSGLSGEKGTKVIFTIVTYSNDRSIKDLPLETIRTFENIKTLVITGDQNRDEEILGALHKIGLSVTVTTFMKSTISQIKTNLSYPDERYNLVIIFDDEAFNGFDVARAIWENNLSGNFVMLMISSNDMKGNYMNCITLGIDHYLIKPFDTNELVTLLKNSFPFIEEPVLSVDIGRVRENLNILIVEDNKMNQKVIGTMLKNLGYGYDVAEDGYAGYLQAKIKKYDLIFMDLIMPEMDGFESSRKILEYDKSVIIVAFTADNMSESKRKAELSGIKDFISKPVRMDDLKRLFARYFKN
jgi:signal transduction histidine kinase/CheY-like chemotaxis protein